jgi:hypothetical protein
MPNAYNGTRHVGAKVIDNLEDVARVVEPRGWLTVRLSCEKCRMEKVRTIVAQCIFIDDTALALVGNICYPDVANSEASSFGLTQYLIPKRLVKLL